MFYDLMIKNGFTMQDCVDAGYFDDGYESADQIMGMLCADSIYNCVLVDAISEKQPDIIVSMSGCFSPFHDGHLHSLKLARDFYESQGLKVLCVLFPAHDSYVDVKRNGTCRKNAFSRIQYMKKFLEESNETDIIIDEFPALQMPRELNFPFLMERISHFAPGVKQSFVVGADNQMFALAIKQTSNDTFIIARDGVEISVSSRLESYGMNMENVHIVYDNEYSHLSSTLIRNKINIDDNKIDGVYLIRDDSSLGGFENVSPKLKDALEKVFDGRIAVDVIDGVKQISECSDFIRSNYSDHVVISMDKYYKGDFSLSCSRIFKKYTYQKTPVGYVIDNEKEFIDFLKALSANSKILVVDDDISSGFSFNYISSIIKTHVESCTIDGFFMNEYYMKTNNIIGEVYDIVDCRDFVVDAPNGGLRTATGRVMYKYPAVNIATRAKIPSDMIGVFNTLMYG